MNEMLIGKPGVRKISEPAHLLAFSLFRFIGFSSLSLVELFLLDLCFRIFILVLLLKGKNKIYLLCLLSSCLDVGICDDESRQVFGSEIVLDEGANPV